MWRTIGIILGVLIIVLGALWLFGPRETLDRSALSFGGEIGEDVDAYLAASEAAVPNLRDGVAKQVVWAGAPGAKTELAIVYLHGFSATKEEIRPVPDKIAAALGANLYFARLTGHGIDGAGMEAARAEDWLRDGAEAMAIGRMLGEQVILMGTSTGATLATLMLEDSAIATDVAGFVGVSPNYRFFGAPLALLTMPFARTVVPMLAGAERSWEPLNEAQGRFWTTTYPMTAILPMASLVAGLEKTDFTAFGAPALFIFNDEDEVVDHVRTREIAAAWGGGAAIVNLTPGPGEAPSKHVIAGDIISPSQTDPATEAVLSWFRGL